MNKKLLIIGAGGHGKVVADTAEQSACWSGIVFIDDGCLKPSFLLQWPVLGTSQDILPKLQPTQYDAAVAIGHNQTRAQWLHKLMVLGFHLPIIQHPQSYISPHAHIGTGTVVFAQAVINIGANIGMGCIINTAASVDHDCRLGNHIHISPGAHLAGQTTVGDYSWLGIGSCTRQQSQIGRHCTIGAGAVVIDSVPDHAIYVGNPAKPLIKVNQHA